MLKGTERHFEIILKLFWYHFYHFFHNVGWPFFLPRRPNAIFNVSLYYICLKWSKWSDKSTFKVTAKLYNHMALYFQMPNSQAQCGQCTSFLAFICFAIALFLFIPGMILHFESKDKYVWKRFVFRMSSFYAWLYWGSVV